MMKRLFFILLMLFISINIGFPTTVYASNAIKITDDDTLNNLDGDGKYLGNNYRDNYYLDIEKTDVFEAGDYMLNQIANALFSIVKILGFAASVFFYRVMVFDVSEVFATEINAIQSTLKLSIFDSFFILAFAASAWSLMKRLTKRDLSGLVVEIGKILCIFLLSSFVVTHSATALSATTSITKDISVSALMNINQQGNVSVESYAANASGMIWKSLVHAPWKSLEFEGGSDDESHVEAFLSESPGTAERKDLVEDYRETYSNAMSKSKGVGRIGFLIVYLIPFLVKSGIYMFIAILQLVFQVMAVFYILLAPVILLLSLVPAFGGIELVSSWLKKILETQIMMLIITFILGIIISLDSFLYSKSSEYGWFIVIFMETLVALIVVINYKSILSGLSKMTASVRQPKALNNQLRRSGDIFGALGSGNGIRNLSPTKRYIRHMNENGYTRPGTSYSPYNNTNYQRYNQSPDTSAFEQVQNRPTVSSPKRYTDSLPVQPPITIQNGHENSRSKVIRPDFHSSGSTYESQNRPIQRPYSYPRKKQPGNTASPEIINTPKLNHNNSAPERSTTSLADTTTTAKPVERPVSSVKSKNVSVPASAPEQSTTSHGRTNTTEKPAERPVSSVKPKNVSVPASAPEQSTTSHERTNTTEKPAERPVSSVKPKNVSVPASAPEQSTTSHGRTNTTEKPAERPVSSVKPKNVSVPASAPEQSTTSHERTNTTEKPAERPVSSVKPKDEPTYNKPPSASITYNLKSTTSSTSKTAQHPRTVPPKSELPVKTRTVRKTPS